MCSDCVFFLILQLRQLCSNLKFRKSFFHRLKLDNVVITTQKRKNSLFDNFSCSLAIMFWPWCISVCTSVGNLNYGFGKWKVCTVSLITIFTKQAGWNRSRNHSFEAGKWVLIGRQSLRKVFKSPDGSTEGEIKKSSDYWCFGRFSWFLQFLVYFAWSC